MCVPSLVLVEAKLFLCSCGSVLSLYINLCVT